MAKDTWERSSTKLPNAGYSHSYVFLNMYHLLEQSRKYPKDTNVSSFLWILWHLWKLRNGLAFEKLQYFSVSVLHKAKEEASIWSEVNSCDTNEEQPQVCRDDESKRWIPPVLGFRKCNIGVSLVASDANCGVAWILRDAKGKTTMHSRRSFSNVGSKKEAELLGIQWAVTDMWNTRQQKIVFEFSCTMARETFLNPQFFSVYRPVLDEISSCLGSIQDWRFDHIMNERNSVAQDIAESVTSEHRYHSYIASGGQSWLQGRIASEAHSS